MVRGAVPRSRLAVGDGDAAPTGIVCGVELTDIRAARDRLAGHVVPTPLVPSPSLSRLCGQPVHLKLETRQTTGSFKLRGAMNALLSLDAAALRRGLVTASSGNHGRALAHAAQEAGARVIVCLSGLVPDHKIAAVRALGAEVRVVGRSQDDAQAEVDRLVREEGLTEIPAFDAPAVIAGQGTVGLEIVEDLPDVELVLLPLSGGGLAAGVAAAVKALRPAARVVGASMSHGAAMHASLAAGRPVPVEEVETLADALAGGIGAENRHTLRLCAALLDDAILLSEDEIAAGIRHAERKEHETVEGGGAVGIAALLAGRVAPRGPVAIVLSGRNIDPALHRRIVAGAVA
jgi:threonine dehydratase